MSLTNLYRGYCNSGSMPHFSVIVDPICKKIMYHIITSIGA